MKTKFIRTRNYEQFKLFTENRPVKKAHVNNLMLSIQQHGLLEEITVNEHREIIDGQHRFFALKNLDLPIQAKVKVGATIDTVLPTNLVRKGWTKEDYVHHYAEKGYSSYRVLREKLKESGKISLGAFVEIYDDLLTHSQKYFKEGRYKINVELGDYIAKQLLKCEKVMHDNTYKAKFIRPFKRMIVKNKNFDIKRFLTIAKKYPINLANNEYDTYNIIKDRYNTGLKPSNRIV